MSLVKFLNHCGLVTPCGDIDPGRVSLESKLKKKIIVQTDIFYTCAKWWQYHSGTDDWSVLLWKFKFKNKENMEINSVS